MFKTIQREVVQPCVMLSKKKPASTIIIIIILSTMNLRNYFPLCEAPKVENGILAIVTLAQCIAVISILLEIINQQHFSNCNSSDPSPGVEK